MRRVSRLSLLFIPLVFLFAGCSSATSGTRPAPAPTQTERVIVVVVTATSESLPTKIVSIEPSITPLPTMTPLVTVTATETLTPTGTPLPTNTVAVSPPQPVVPTNTPVPTAVALRYPAPNLLAPGERDAKHTNEDIPFLWSFSDGRSLDLNADECYALHVIFTSRVTNKPLDGYFDTCTYPNSFSVLAGPRAQFVLNRPRWPGPNYSSFVPDLTFLYDVKWCLNVIRKPDNQPLSPEACLTFPLLGG